MDEQSKVEDLRSSLYAERVRNEGLSRVLKQALAFLSTNRIEERRVIIEALQALGYPDEDIVRRLWAGDSNKEDKPE